MSSDAESLSDDLCKDFLNGICKRRNCRFRHVGEANDEGESSICRDFLRNVCNRKNCRFRHPAGGEKREITKKLEYTFCHDFTNDTCTRRDCRFMHATNEEEEYFHKTGILPPHLRAQAAVGLGSTEKGVATGVTPVCRDFLQGKCDRGNRCKFRHADTDRRDYEDVLPVPRSMYAIPEREYEPEYFGGRAPKRRAFDMYGGYDPYVRRNEYMMLEDENALLRRKLEELKKQVSDLAGANDILLEQNARLRVSKVASLTAMTMSSPSNMSPAIVTPIVTPAVVGVSTTDASNAAAAQLSALTASISQQVALNSEVVQHAFQQQLAVQEVLGAPQASMTAAVSMTNSMLTPAISMSQPALLNAAYALP